MTDAARRPMPAQRFRVMIHAPDSMRHERLRRFLFDAGHAIVDAIGLADVVVADGDFPPAGELPVLALGSVAREHAGLLARDASAAQIDAAVRAVANGLTVRAAGSASDGFAALNESRLADLLTTREIEVLDALVEGLPNKAIAQRLDISLHTVKFHVESVFRKLGVRTRTEAAARAWRYRGDAFEL